MSPTRAGVLDRVPDQTLAWLLDEENPAVATLTRRRLLGEGRELQGTLESAPLVARVADLDLPLEPLRGTFDGAALVEGTRAELELELPPVRYREARGRFVRATRELDQALPVNCGVC